jgi:metallophosphoesterase (TIGR00282 family)
MATIKIIFLGDIIGKIGRHAIAKHLPELKKKYQPDVVIANVENLAHGIGFTQRTLDEIFEAGVDYGTAGNHTWAKAGTDEILDAKNPRVIRPANVIEKKSGVGFLQISIGKTKVLLINLLGQIGMKEEVKSPFKTLDTILKKHPKLVTLVDFHTETTSEKNAFAHYADGRVSAVLGTHTHVPTADARILPHGTATVTDAGMIGYYDSVIGANKEQVVKMFLGDGKGSKKHDQPDTGDCQFNAIYLEIDTRTRRTSVIERLDAIITVS